MNPHIQKYFLSEKSSFSSVVPLHESKEWSQEELLEKVGSGARGWGQLARLSVEDRIEFTHQFWVSQLPYHPQLEKFLNKFFSALDDIGLFLTQDKNTKQHHITMVYSLKHDQGFFRGELPATDDQCRRLQSEFTSHILPEDYFAFMKIHNGFCKTTDSTGIVPLHYVNSLYIRLQEQVAVLGAAKTSMGTPVDPSSLVPFYESFGLPYFQCFWDEWHPQQEMGNVYCSVLEGIISDPKEGEAGVENLAFKTFIDWLLFYLEQITDTP